MDETLFFDSLSAPFKPWYHSWPYMPESTIIVFKIVIFYRTSPELPTFLVVSDLKGRCSFPDHSKVFHWHLSLVMIQLLYPCRYVVVLIVSSMGQKKLPFSVFISSMFPVKQAFFVVSGPTSEVGKWVLLSRSESRCCLFFLSQASKFKFIALCLRKYRIRQITLTRQRNIKKAIKTD